MDDERGKETADGDRTRTPATAAGTDGWTAGGVTDAAVAVTTTGFSGRLIAGTNTVAQVSIIAGLAIIMASCLTIFLRVLSVEWVISRHLEEKLQHTLVSVIESRNRKTRAYRLGSAGVFVGLTVYAIAIAIMLLNPEPLAVPVR